ncbi:MAG: hypothetical protein JNK46_14815 [Methylobacteriaceae bacterium]|nr:hypothetical protein [Methylobacteriaceae bacterium]
MSSAMFDTAITNFYNASVNRDDGLAIRQLALGLQQFCAAVRNQESGKRGMFETAITNFYNASINRDDAAAIRQTALGCQQFCAGVKARD